MRQDRALQVLILDADPLIARGYARLIETVESHRVVGLVASVARAWEALRTCPIDMVVIGDLESPGEAAMFLRNLRFANLPLDVIVISSRCDASAVRESQRLGVSDYLITPIVPERFIQSVRQVAQYGRLAATQLAQAEIDQLRSLSVPSKPWVPRELSAERLATVRRHLARATAPVSAAQVAAHLDMSRVTARRYLEFLVTLGELEFDNVSHRPGRPSKLYAPRLSIAN